MLKITLNGKNYCFGVQFYYFCTNINTVVKALSYMSTSIQQSNKT